MNKDELEKSAPIASAAILYKGVIHSMPRPNRHHNILWAYSPDEKSGHITSTLTKGEQGFIDERGNFLNRKDAAEIAAFWEQLKTGRLIASPNLFSEDMW